MALTKISVNVTCTASNATVDTPVPITGYLYAIRYTKATASAVATGSTCTFTVLSAVSGTNGPMHDIGTFVGTSANGWFFPRYGVHTSAFASGGATGLTMMPLSGELIRTNIASGGASGVARFDFYIEGFAP